MTNHQIEKFDRAKAKDDGISEEEVKNSNHRAIYQCI